MKTCNTPILTLASVAATLAFSVPAHADDGGLYAKPLDPNSAFVRVIAPGASNATVGSSSFNQLENGVSPYVAGPWRHRGDSKRGSGQRQGSGGKFIRRS